jgi:hypothetical protein
MRILTTPPLRVHERLAKLLVGAWRMREHHRVAATRW